MAGLVGAPILSSGGSVSIPLTAEQIQNSVRAGNLNQQELADAYAKNGIATPQQIPYSQLVSQGQGVVSPNANGVSTSSTPVVSGGTTAPTTAQTAPLLASLATLDTILGNNNDASQEEHDKAIQGYDTQDQIDQNSIQQNKQQNETNLTSNDQAALLNAANASTGLRGVLSGLGGLAGSGVDIVRKLVGLAAGTDTGNARQTFNTNATSLNTAAETTTAAEAARRAEADATLENDKQNNEASVLNSKQTIFQQLASLFGAGTTQGDNYASEAAGLAAPIAATTKAVVAPYAAGSSLYSPSSLATYLAGTQKLNAGSTTADSTPINSPTFGTTTKKDTLTGVA